MTDNLDNALREERDRLIQEQDDHEKTIRDAQKELDKIVPRLRLVRALLGETESEHSTNSQGIITSGVQALNRPTVCDIAEAILAERNREPMHYKDLSDEVMKRGVKLGGARPEATLSAKLNTDPKRRFIRPFARGYYALRSDYPDAENIGARNNTTAGRPSN